MPRYAVLRALEGAGLPVGLVIERRGYVHVEALDEYGLPRRFDEEYRVLGRDLVEVMYRPGDAGYFDQVLVDLSRHVSVAGQGEVDDAEWGTVLRLFQEKVVDPRLRGVAGHYVVRRPVQAAYYLRPLSSPQRRPHRSRHRIAA